MKKIHPLAWLFWLALFLFFLISPTDPDLGWHLRCGQEIWQGQGWCEYNRFSVLLENFFWPNLYWFYQVMIFAFFKAAGLWGLTILNALLMSLAFLLFYLAIRNYAWEKMLALGLIIFLGGGVFSFGIRSQITGFFFFNLLLWLFSKIRSNEKMALFLPPIMLLWANTHGSFVVGLVLLAFGGLYWGVNRPGKILPVTVILTLSLAAIFLNPFGLKIYPAIWQHFAGVNLAGLIAEWVPPQPFIRWLIFIGSLGLSVYVLILGKVKNLPLSFLTVAFAVLALKAQRSVPFFFLLSFFLFLSLPVTKLSLAGWLKEKILRNNLAILTAAALLFFGLFIRLPETLALNSSWSNYCQNSSVVYPCRAVEFLKKQPEKGIIFNRYEWGGFLIWQLPEYRIFVDGRMPAWPAPEGKSPYTIYLETLQNQPGWQETLKRYNVDWILISPGTFMDLLLAPQPEKFGWDEVFRDKMAVVYQKR